MSLSLQVDGGTAITGTTTTIRTSFDEIAFSTGFSATNAVTFVVDNVNVTATVPEPSSALLLASSAAMCFGFRRRRSK